jgi:hypothetical protein
MSIADTIVPWTSEWLMYYEIWLATSDWYGGGVWPPRRTAADSLVDNPDTGIAAKERPRVA